MYKTYLKIFSAYFIGFLFWMVLISVLQIHGVLNVPRFVDCLWTKQINNDLVVNLIGSIAYKTGEWATENELIYLVRDYSDSDLGDNYKYVTLTSLVDTASWREVSSDSITTTYQDKEHEYVLYNISDATYMRVSDK